MKLMVKGGLFFLFICSSFIVDGAGSFSASYLRGRCIRKGHLPLEDCQLSVARPFVASVDSVVPRTIPIVPPTAAFPVAWNSSDRIAVLPVVKHRRIRRHGYIPNTGLGVKISYLDPAPSTLTLSISVSNGSLVSFTCTK
jgi:hypothetical protein